MYIHVGRCRQTDRSIGTASEVRPSLTTHSGPERSPHPDEKTGLGFRVTNFKDLHALRPWDLDRQRALSLSLSLSMCIMASLVRATEYEHLQILMFTGKKLLP